jgi:PAS domain S-box-containing protein
MHSLLERQLKKCFGRTEGLPEEVARFAAAVNEAYVQADNDREMIERSMELSSRELLDRNRELVQTEAKYRAIFENVTEGIFQTTPQGRFISVNPAMAKIFGYESAEQLMEGVTDIGTQIYALPQRRKQIEAEIGRHGSITNWESKVRRRDGEMIWISETVRAVRDAEQNILYYEGSAWDITTRKQAEQEREDLQSQLIGTSRRAGMAEVATGVLHNVGNVLNSINVSASLVTDRVRASKVLGVEKVAQMLVNRRSELAVFLTEDEKGRQVPDYLSRLAEALCDEQSDVLRELNTLVENVEHIKQIVSTQQGYAKVAGVNERVRLPDLIDNAININRESLERHRVDVKREYEELPPAQVDKHQVLQILINLISNAKHAVVNHRGDRKVIIRLKPSPSRPGNFMLQVSDSGMGIPKENLTQIFSHGFTTRRDGHGFGLHTSALAAQSMGGSLTAHSDGPGLGATFTLELPHTPPRPTESTGSNQ